MVAPGRAHPRRLHRNGLLSQSSGEGRPPPLGRPADIVPTSRSVLSRGFAPCAGVACAILGSALDNAVPRKPRRFYRDWKASMYPGRCLTGATAVGAVQDALHVARNHVHAGQDFGGALRTSQGSGSVRVAQGVEVAVALVAVGAHDGAWPLAGSGFHVLRHDAPRLSADASPTGAAAMRPACSPRSSTATATPAFPAPLPDVPRLTGPTKTSWAARALRAQPSARRGLKCPGGPGRAVSPWLRASPAPRRASRRPPCS